MPNTKRPDTPLAETPKPNYGNMKTKQEVRGYQEAVKRGLTPRRN